MIRSATFTLIHRLLNGQRDHSHPPAGLNLMPWWIADHLLVYKRRPIKDLPRVMQLLKFPPGVKLSLEMPGDVSGNCHSSPGPRLFFSPRGVPSAATLGIASSRLPRPWYRQPWWFERLAAVCQHACQNSNVVLGVSGATVTQFLPACDRIHGTTSWLLQLAPRRQQLQQWLDSLPTVGREEHQATRWQTWVSPALVSESCCDNPASSLPLADCLLVHLADQLQVLSCRPNGKLEQVIRELAAGTEIPAAGWWSEPVHAVKLLVDEQGGQPAANDSITTLETADLAWQEYLAHWTRDQDGPWPNELLDDWLDQLLRGAASRHHTALHALQRIIRQQRIIASARAIRGGTPVTCFTAVPVNEWQRHRVYRVHRRRWDFLPYAIGIKRSWLLDHGARPVSYGKDSDWQRLSTSERPFFQRSHSEGLATPINWQQEREWRIVGDLELGDLSGQDGFLLVPDPAAARALVRLSRWPVIAESAASADRPVLHPGFEH